MVKQFKVGHNAPDFCLLDTESKSRCLKEFLGQKVVLVFFVETFTLESTKELCLFRDSMSELTNLHAQVVGITASTPEANKQLTEKQKLHFPILSDFDHKVIEAYGLEEKEQQNAKRAILVLNEDGVIIHKWVSNNIHDEPAYDEIKTHLKHTLLKKHASMVAPKVITVSRQKGSGGDEIAQHISQMLGWVYVNKSVLVEVGRSLGYHEADIVDFCESNYRVQSFTEKLMTHRPVRKSVDTEDDDDIRKTLNEEQCLRTIQTVISNLSGKGNIVIVGRGGQAILKHKVGVLHVRVVAPRNVRAARIMNEIKVSEEQAQRIIEESDEAAAEYLQRFYGIDWNDPENYDVVVNTEKLDFSAAALMIAQLAAHT